RHLPNTVSMCSKELGRLFCSGRLYQQ
ncbi:hypothetical protein D030_4231B, partial [Vibrio parahaemolyticus AQ3810]